MARFVADVSQSRSSTESHLPAVAERVVLFHFQDYAVAGLLDHDSFAWSECATEGHTGADHTPIWFRNSGMVFLNAAIDVLNGLLSGLL